MEIERLYDHPGPHLNDEFARLERVDRELSRSSLRLAVSFNVVDADEKDIIIQLENEAGGVLEAQALIEVWTADTRYGGDSAGTPTSWTAKDDTVITEAVTTQRQRCLTGSSGKATIRVRKTAPRRVWYIRAALIGLVFGSENEIAFSPP